MTDAAALDVATPAGSEGPISDALPAVSPVAEAPAPASSRGPTFAAIGFDDFPLGPEVRSALVSMGYTRPTEVQAAVITESLAGKDLVVQAKTGSGKTTGFGLPIIERLPVGVAKPNKPLSLILAPTRELAVQVAEELARLGRDKGTRVEPIYGGVSMGRQVQALEAGLEVVVGTPGRLLDHIRRKTMSLDECRMVVLDEADEMLSMGFWDDVTALMQMAPPTRQTMLFSATLPYQVAKAAAQFLKEPARIDLSGDAHSVEGIDNRWVQVRPDTPKPRQLLYILEFLQPKSAIIFCNTRNEVEMMAKYLTQNGFMAEALAGNIRQRDRERVMARIKAQDLRYMVATDIASRGIDITDLSHVINYSLPEFPEVYVHRVGRTGRIGKSGTAVSLLDGKGMATQGKLARDFGIELKELVVPSEDVIQTQRNKRIMQELLEKASVSEVGQHLPVAGEILSDPNASQVVAFLLKSYFNQQANEAVRGSRSDQADGDRERDNGGGGGGGGGGRHHGGRHEGRGRGPRREARPPRAEGAPEGEGDEGAAPVDGVQTAEGQGVEGEQGGPRRRRRRRGRRGRRGEGLTDGMETMDARDALAGPVGLASTRSAPAPVTTPVDVSSDAAPTAPVSVVADAAPVVQAAAPAMVIPAVEEGFSVIRVNIGFDDGFKGRGAVAKKISSLAGLNDGIITEIEARRDFALLKAKKDVADLLVDRCDGAQIGKKILSIAVGG